MNTCGDDLGIVFSWVYHISRIWCDVIEIFHVCVCGSFGCWKLTALTSGSRDDSEHWNFIINGEHGHDSGYESDVPFLNQRTGEIGIKGTCFINFQ